jgi:adenosine deaminase
LELIAFQSFFSVVVYELFSMEDFIRKIPKAEVHLHVDGSLTPELLWKLSQRNQGHVTIPYTSIQQIEQAYHFTNLQSFLDLYVMGASVQLYEQDFYDVLYAYLQTAAQQQNIRHVDVHMEPQTHTQRGISIDTILQGYIRAQNDAQQQFHITSTLILAFQRHLSEQEAIETLQLVLQPKYRPYISAIGLDFTEVGHPPSKFQKVYEMARQAPYNITHFTCHAGEEGMPTPYIWEAIRTLQVDRIDHGVKCDQDDDLVQYLVESQLPLNICPLSNVKLGVFPTIKDHNVKTLYDRGIKLTISSDDPGYFGSTMVDNYQAIHDELGFTQHDLYVITKNTFEIAYISDEQKQVYLQELEDFMRKYSINSK